MPDLLRWPFPLPERFLEALGYTRTVEAFQSPASRARLAEVLRQHGIDATPAVPTGPRRYVALYWDAGDELGWDDGAHRGAGQLEHWVWLDYLRGRGQLGSPIYGWLIEHEINLGTSDEPATHALIVDVDEGTAYVAPLRGTA